MIRIKIEAKRIEKKMRLPMGVSMGFVFPPLYTKLMMKNKNKEQ